MIPPYKKIVICLIALAAGLLSAKLIKHPEQPTRSNVTVVTNQAPAPEDPPSTTPEYDYITQVARYQADPSAPGASLRLKAAIFSLKPEELAPALQELAQREFHDDGSTFIRALFARWVEVDPHGAISAANDLPVNSLQSVALYTIWGTWALTDPEAAFRHLDSPLTADFKDRAEQTFWHELALKKPLRALKIAATIPDDGTRNRRNIEDEINRLQASGDPGAALAWALKNRSPEEAVDRVEEIFWSWGEQEPQEGLKNLLRLPEVYQTAEAFAQLAGGATRRSADQALALLPDVPPAHRAAFLARVVDQEAENNHNPLAAAAIAAQIPDGKTKENVYRSLTSSWSHYDATAASKWVSSLAPSRSRDIAASAVSNHQRETDPEAATIWGAFIDNPKMRLSTTEDSFASWHLQDPESAFAWLQQTNRFTEDQKQSLLPADL